MSFAKKTKNNRDWTTKTHSDEAKPSYDILFAQGKLQRIDITISSSDWSAMWAEIDENLGANHPAGGMGMGPGPGMPPMMGMEPGQGMGAQPRPDFNADSLPPRPEGRLEGGRPEGGRPEGGHPEGREGRLEGHPDLDSLPMPMPAPMATDEFTPMWIPCTITYNGKNWCQVGLRIKGNSSLSHAYMSGNSKLSMKLDFDEYEDDYPELKNQRFYGFKQLNLNNNYEDSSLMREKVASDLFRNFGLASAQTAFCEVYIDYGEGSQYFGLYTIVEEVDDTVIKNSFAKSKGNLYKPEERAGSFAFGTFCEEEFNLATKSDKSLSDVKALYDLLHDASRLDDPTAWQQNLESIFDVKSFIKWLAANNVIQNWDSYGNMAHNYYLYNNPENNLLIWIPWDSNEAFQRGQNRWELSQMDQVDNSWPLISYLFALSDYEQLYRDYLREFVDEIFEVSSMQALYDQYYNLLKESAYAEQNGRTFLRDKSQFDAAVAILKEHVESRREVVGRYLVE
ncbi:MAG: CotH kinase family protein [Rikenellaceae bacterium]